MPNSKQFDVGRPARDRQMRAMQKVTPHTDRSSKPGPDIKDPVPPRYPGPIDVPSNQTATNEK
ncbi:MAG: hypothetical protein C5B60_05360 [Chloroflexi bacterium]|nr:MAG: hypothetical protein C5B60_05360 [Chloroflexota bacterium]